MSGPPFFTRYGMSRTSDAGAPLSIEPYPEICHEGVLRRAVIASAIDIVGSLYAREAAGTDVTFTTDLSLRAPPVRAPERLLARGRLLRAGRSALTAATSLEAEGAVVAYGETSFAIRPRPPGETVDPARLALPSVIERVPLATPLVREVGIETRDAAAGHVELALGALHRNPEGLLQGALVALLCEVAAESAAGAHTRGPAFVTELDIRYLAAARVGPVASRAHWIGDPSLGMLRIELVDRGRDDRLTTTALARVAHW